MSKLVAVNNYVFIEKDEAQSEKKGLVIPSYGKEKPSSGIIFSVGEAVQDRKIKNAVGKKVLFHKGIGFNMEVDDKEYLVLEGHQIIAIV